MTIVARVLLIALGAITLGASAAVFRLLATRQWERDATVLLVRGVCWLGVAGLSLFLAVVGRHGRWALYALAGVVIGDVIFRTLWRRIFWHGER